MTTFHESWYRVSSLKPRLRTTVQTTRQHFRGQCWHVVQDHSHRQFARLSDAAYHFMGLLDGRRTVEQAWRICHELHGDAAPTQGEAINLLGQLYSSNLLQSDLPGDAASMFKLQQQRVRREVGGYLANLLFIRIPLGSPDAFLGRCERLLGVIFSPVGLLAWLVLAGAAVVTVAGRFEALIGSASNIIAPHNLLLLYLSFAAVKVVHELGHGVASKRVGRLTGQGGEVQAMGVSLLVFTPVPFVDASSSWAFRSKWHRALVGAAGMYVELAVAAIAAIVWANTSAGTVHALAYNVMFVASVSTVAFNGNPLFRFDGYYILSDLLEIPNLARRSRDQLLYLIKRYVYGLHSAIGAALTGGERWWLPAYGLAAAAYRVVISVGIIMFLADHFFFVGVLLALLVFVTWAVVPLWQMMRYLTAGVELARCRTRAMLITGTFFAALFGGLGFIPVPDRGRAEGVVEPIELAAVFAEVDGFVRQVMPTGASVTPQGEPLLICENLELVTRRQRLGAEAQLTEYQRDEARVREIALAQSLEQRLAALREQLAQIDERLSALVVSAPTEGRWIAPDVDRLTGRYLRQGEAIGYVASVDRLLVRAVTDQRLGPRLEQEIGIGGIVEVRPLGRPGLELLGRIQEVLPAGQLELPSAALGYQAGGWTPVAADDSSGNDHDRALLRSAHRVRRSGGGRCRAVHRSAGGRAVLLSCPSADRAGMAGAASTGAAPLCGVSEGTETNGSMRSSSGAILGVSSNAVRRSGREVPSEVWRRLSVDAVPRSAPVRGLDAVWNSAAGAFARVVRHRRASLSRASQVLAREREVAQLGEAALQDQLGALQVRFRLERQSDDDVLLAFAMVREVVFRCLGFRLHREQVAAGLAIHDGCVAEMATGEGKTVSATLPAVVAGWRGRGCHVLTFNSYLAGRDAAAMAPVYASCGLQVGHIEPEMAPADRRRAYRADITYCTNQDVAADYLRDRLALGPRTRLGAALLADVIDGSSSLGELSLRGLESAIVDEADSILVDEAVTPLIISGDAPNQEQVEAYETAAWLAGRLERDTHYQVAQRYREVTLTAAGSARLRKMVEPLRGMWAARRRREEFVVQAITARELFIRDQQYVVKDGEIVIVDESTGRLMPDRTWRAGLHQAVEAKEGLRVKSPKETMARISFQRFFRMYRRLGGMSGTVWEARHELWQVFGLPSVVLPTHRPCRRRLHPDRVYRDLESKWVAILAEIKAVHEQGRPVLVGTRSVEASEMLSRLLVRSGLTHQVLNAVRHAEEASIVAGAGERGRITVATNMAGRGTDIKLGAGVEALGGLHVIATERHESSRIDRQLFGRAARQGDPGSAVAFVSLEDELCRRYAPVVLRDLALRRGGGAISAVVSKAQSRAERLAARQRRSVLEADDWLDRFLGFAG